MPADSPIPNWTGKTTPMDDLAAALRGAQSQHALAIATGANAWLDGLHAASARSIDEGIDYVIETLSGADLLSPLAADRIETLNFVLPAVDPALLPLTVAVAILMETFRNRARLPGRAVLYGKMWKMLEEREPARVAKVLGSLR